jgi:hypothetical protein
MSAAAYDLLGGHFEFDQEAPPYLPNAPPPIYKPKSVCRTVAPVSPHSWIGLHSAFHMTTTTCLPLVVPARTMQVSFPHQSFPHQRSCHTQTLMSLGVPNRVIGV